jgi:hypothetical protein
MPNLSAKVRPVVNTRHNKHSYMVIWSDRDLFNASTTVTSVQEFSGATVVQSWTATKARTETAREFRFRLTAGPRTRPPPDTDPDAGLLTITITTTPTGGVPTPATVDVPVDYVNDNHP